MAILAGVIACAGAWIKLLSVAPDRFFLLMIGQVLESISFAMCYGMISLIPAMWFGSKEISFVGTLPIISTQVCIDCALVHLPSLDILKISFHSCKNARSISV